jgi:hypothetical protein
MHLHDGIRLQLQSAHAHGKLEESMCGLLNTEWVELDLKLPVNNDGHCSLTAASANVYLVHNTCDSSRGSCRGDGSIWVATIAVLPGFAYMRSGFCINQWWATCIGTHQAVHAH